MDKIVRLNTQVGKKELATVQGTIVRTNIASLPTGILTPDALVGRIVSLKATPPESFDLVLAKGLHLVGTTPKPYLLGDYIVIKCTEVVGNGFDVEMMENGEFTLPIEDLDYYDEVGAEQALNGAKLYTGVDGKPITKLCITDFVDTEATHEQGASQIIGKIYGLVKVEDVLTAVKVLLNFQEGTYFEGVTIDESTSY